MGQKEWFSAMWQTPSTDWPNVTESILKMAKKLHIERSWGRKKGD
jgi:hypothetical protein